MFRELARNSYVFIQLELQNKAYLLFTTVLPKFPGLKYLHSKVWRCFSRDELVNNPDVTILRSYEHRSGSILAETQPVVKIKLSDKSNVLCVRNVKSKKFNFNTFRIKMTLS